MNYYNNPWFVSYKSNITIKMRLFCFHHAGGTGSFFKGWKDFFPPEIEIVAIQLPGREARLSESFLTNIDDVIEGVIYSFSKYQDRPFIFFGHSLGGFISFEIVRRLRRLDLCIPKYLIISGQTAPQLPPEKEILHILQDHEFIEALNKYGGMPEEILRNEELMEVLLPRLRADFTISETYNYIEEPPVNCSILVLGGRNDSTVDHKELIAWGNQTTKKCLIKLFPGGHFFINSFQKLIFRTLENIIQNKL